MTGEERLEGGNVTGGVVRIGATVRRPAAPHTQTVHRLLRHVRHTGVTWVPGVHGLDEQGREVLDFIPGDVAHGDPAWIRDEAVLIGVMRAMREWHDATASFERHGSDVWSQPDREPAEVICHADFAPYNHIYQDGRLVGAIDFDICHPGPRLWDIAWTAYRYIPLTPPTDAVVADGEGPDRSPFTVQQMRERAKVALDAYGSDASVDELLSWVVARLDAIADWGQTQDSAEHLAWARMYRAHARWIEAGGLAATG